MNLPHPDISGLPPIVQLAALPPHTERVIRAIEANTNNAAAIVADERERIGEILYGTPGLTTLIDTHTAGMHGRRPIVDVRAHLDTTINANITDVTQPLLDPGRTRILDAFVEMDNHFHTALRGLSTSMRPAPLAPPPVPPKTPEEIRNDTLKALLAGDPSLAVLDEALSDLASPEKSALIDFWKSKLNDALSNVLTLPDAAAQKIELLKQITDRNSPAKILRTTILNQQKTKTP